EGPQGLFVVKARSCELSADRPSNMQIRCRRRSLFVGRGLLYIIDIWHGHHGSWNEQSVSGPAPIKHPAARKTSTPPAAGKRCALAANGSAVILEPVDANAVVGLLSDATSRLAQHPRRQSLRTSRFLQAG